MSVAGYCTIDDLRRALRSADLPGDAVQDPAIATDAITGQTEWLQETANRHWFAPEGIEEDDESLIPSEPLTHEHDEQDIKTSAVIFEDDPITPSTDGPGAFTTVELFRRDVLELTELLVLGVDGTFTDWVDSAEYSEGRAGDYYLQVDDADGWSKLYLNTNALDTGEDDEEVDAMTDFRNAVVATYEYGIEGADAAQTVRRAIALRAGAQLLLDDEAALGIPENASFVSAESKVQAMERQAEELLGIHEDTR